MEQTYTDRDLLQDLAIIYIAFAHGTDQELSDVEIDVIAERLRAWNESLDGGTALSAIKGALTAYTHDEGQREVDRAVKNVRLSAPVDVRRRVVNDLLDIAMVDGVFLHAESAAIKDLETAWDVRGAEDDSNNGYSVIDRREQYEGWTALHDLALIYLVLAHGSDHDLSAGEVEIITRKLAEWMPDAPVSEVLDVVKGAMGAYAQGADKRMLAESVDALRRFVPEHQREALLDDLRRIAEADGAMIKAEEELITRLRAAWTGDAA